MKNRARRLITAAAAAATLAVSTAADAQTRMAAYGFSDGKYTGRREYAYYGFVRVEALVNRGRLFNVRVLEYPHDNGTSRYINGVALPYLIREAVHAQSHRVDLISGATFTSVAFEKSRADAQRRAGR